MSKSGKSLIQALHHASQVAEREFEDAIGGVGITARQAMLLVAIAEHGAVNQSGLGRRTNIDRSTASEMLRRLAKAGLISMKRSRRDGRAYVVNLTAPGETAARKAKPTLDAVEHMLLARLDKKQAAEIVEALDAMALPPAEVE
jgi:MarR family transcriptional regulator, lower aerobic nicotinate degradation pathway regulator